LPLSDEQELTYRSGLIQFMQDILLYGFSTFLPSILKAMGYDTLQSNYLTIPVYLWGAAAFMILAFISDKYSIRGPVSPSHLILTLAI